MKTFTTYIIYSKTIDKFYTGSTSMDVVERLYRHNCNHNGFTGKANDWNVVYKSAFRTIEESRKLESQIKKRGAKRYINDLEA